jgi:hypothetical protein
MRLVEGVRAQVAAVQRVLAAIGAGEFDIAVVLCFLDGDGLPLLRRLAIDEIAITDPRGAAKRTAPPGRPDRPTRCNASTLRSRRRCGPGELAAGRPCRRARSIYGAKGSSGLGARGV